MNKSIKLILFIILIFAGFIFLGKYHNAYAIITYCPRTATDTIRVEGTIFGAQRWDLCERTDICPRKATNYPVSRVTYSIDGGPEVDMVFGVQWRKLIEEENGACNPGIGQTCSGVIWEGDFNTGNIDIKNYKFTNSYPNSYQFKFLSKFLSIYQFHSSPVS